MEPTACNLGVEFVMFSVAAEPNVQTNQSNSRQNPLAYLTYGSRMHLVWPTNDR